MLKKLFSRKKESQKPQPKSEPQKSSTPDTLEQTLSTIQSAQGKAKTQALVALAEKIDQGALTLADARQHLPALEGIMLALAYDENPGDVSADQWRQLALQGYTAKVRKAAAVNIKDFATLTELVKETKGKDKAVYRILHDELDVQHAQQKEADQWNEKKRSVLESVQKLAEAPLEPMYEAKLKGLIEQWRELGIDNEDENALFQSAEKDAQLKIEATHAKQAEQQAQAEHIEMADDNRQQLINQLISRMQTRISDLDFTEQSVSDDQHFLTDIQHKWREIEQHRKAGKDDHRAFQRASTAFEVGLPRLQHLIEKHGSLDTILSTLLDSENDNEALLHEIDDWLHEIEFVLSVDVPETVVKLQQALKQYQQSLAQHRQQEIDRVRSIRGQLRRCMQAVEDGSLRRASGLFHGVEEKLEGFDLTHHVGIRKQLDETTEALEKLRDWQSYAVLPKKEALIKRMSALVEHSMDPESRAQTIRDMQDEWKLLSRGLQNRQQDLWETFHDLAQQAYEPCKEFFSEQRHLREINLDRRKEVVEQLTKYAEIIHWDAPDIKEIDRVLQLARNDWRRYSPVDRVANKPVQAEFDRVYKRMFDRLRQEQDIFKQGKLAIIEKAKELLQLEDIKEATDKAKQLQSEWKDAGTVARRDEQQLWKAFREVCDELFARREQQVNDFKADLEVNREKAEQLIAGIEELVSSDQVLAELSVYENLKEQFEQVGTLPKAHYAKLSKRYRSACQAYDSLCKQARLQSADQHWLDVIHWVKQARFTEQSMDELLAQWSNMKVPEEARKLKELLPVWQQPVDELNQAALHEKTVDLEIMLGVDSPSEDEKIRMNIQVQRLSEGIGSSVSLADVNELVVDWLATGSVVSPLYDQYETRMLRARNRWLSKQS